MSILFRVAAAAEIVCVWVEYSFPATHGILPLGGSPITQIGLLFAPPFVIGEWWVAWSALLERIEYWRLARARRVRARKRNPPQAPHDQ